MDAVQAGYAISQVMARYAAVSAGGIGAIIVAALAYGRGSGWGAGALFIIGLVCFVAGIAGLLSFGRQLGQSARQSEQQAIVPDHAPIRVNPHRSVKEKMDEQEQ